MPATTSVQIKITLPARLQKRVQSKANKYGLTVSTYIKHLVLDDVKDIEMPVFRISSKTEEVLENALQDHARGKTHLINDVDEFLETL